MLTSRDSDRLAEIVLSKVSKGGLSNPGAKEHEPAFTARVLMPRVREALRDIDIAGLTLAGDGAAPAPVIALPSCDFHPDIALLYHRARLVAFEVKYLRSTGRQQALTCAIGQSVMYKAKGYQAVGVILVDLNPVPGDAAAIRSIFKGLRELSFFGRIFSKSGSTLVGC